MGRRGRLDARWTRGTRVFRVPVGRGSAWVLFSFAAIGCEGAATADGPLVRDSAGVRIVENRAPAWGEDEGLRISAEATVVIGTVDGPEEQQLNGVRDATVLPAGRIALLNSGAARWQIHGADGSHLRTMGTRGEGPGEFQMLDWIATRGDTILIFDGWQGVGRLSLYDLAGDLLGTERIEVDGLDFPRPDVVLSDGRYLDERTEGSIPPAEPGHVALTRYFVAYQRDGSCCDTLAIGLGSERFKEGDGQGMSYTEVPFGRASHTAVGVARFFLGNGHSSFVAGYDFSGSHVVSVGLPGHRRPLTEEDRERWIEATLSTSFFVGRPDAARRLRRVYSGSPLPDSTPVHAELEVDAAGRLWVQRYVPPWEDANDWWVFTPDGAWLGTVSLPPGLRVFEIGDDYVLGVTQDELDVEYVVKYALGAGPA